MVKPLSPLGKRALRDGACACLLAAAHAALADQVSATAVGTTA